MIHESHPGGDSSLAAAVNVQLQLNIGFPGFPTYLPFPHPFSRHRFLPPLRPGLSGLKKLPNDITIIIFFFTDISNISPLTPQF